MRDTGGHHLAQHGDVTILEVVRVDLACEARQLREALRLLEHAPVGAHPPGADEFEGGQQQFFNAAEVVEDQRLVEGSSSGNLSCARGGKSFRLQRLKRRLGDPELRSA